MGRPKLDKKDKKSKLGITIDKNLNQQLDSFTSNKSKFIENLLIDFFKQQIK